MSTFSGATPRKQASTTTPRKSILSNKQTGVLKVWYEGEDLTPEPMNPQRMERASIAPKGRRSRSQTSYLSIDESPTTNEMRLMQTQSASRFQTELQKQTVLAESALRQTFLSDKSYVDEVVIQPEMKEMMDEVDMLEEDKELENLPPGEDYKVRPVQNHISLVLTETPTMWLLEFPSRTVDKDSKEASAVLEANDRYAYLTVGKGRNRKMVTSEAQTTPVLMKCRSTEAERTTRRHNVAFAAVWDMCDTYQEEEPAQEDPKEFIDEEDGAATLPKPQENMPQNYNDCEMVKLMQNQKFLEAACVLERLLASNNFSEEQKRFSGLSDPNPFRENIEYKYRLRLLWTFSIKEVQDRCVTALCWNYVNPEVLAAGYGKFFYTEKAVGVVLIWNIKNPIQPERTYRFVQPVTTLNFSKLNPNLLGVGFYDGTLKLIDISSRELKVIGKNGKDSPSFEPIWQILWLPGSDYLKGQEQVITTCQDGRISNYKAQDTVELIYGQLMRIARPEGRLKGIEILRKCHAPGIPITRYASALVIQPHPVDKNIYYVGTNEGTIHRCSWNYHHQHLDLFLAHQGPIYAIKFSPFCNKLFATCGDDWHVRIWAEGIIEPLFELTKAPLSVQGVDWSPTFATIIANISGTEIMIWDLQRKIHLPQSVTQSPTNSRNTVIQFTESGRCLVVGDLDGNVHVFSLEDMPFPAFFPDDLFINSINRSLITRPDLRRKLKKLGSWNYTAADFDKHFT